MKKVELFEIIRKEYFQNKQSIRYIAKTHGVHRRQVRQAIANAVPPVRKLCERRCSVLTEQMKQVINQWIKDDLQAPRKQQHTGKRVYDRLVADYCYNGHESTVRNFVYQKRKDLLVCTKVFVPQIHMPGEEAEVDWYEAMVDFPRGREKTFIFQMRACFSGKEFHMAFSRCNQQAFIEGHIAAFNYFGGVFKIIRYDNLTSAVKKVLRGRKRIETDKFIALRSHYLFEAMFCLPGIQGAHEKGGVECGGGRFRRSHLVPVPKVSGINELNQSLITYCKQDDQRVIIGKQAAIAIDWEAESLQLSRLPKEEFSTAEVISAGVDNKSLVALKGNHYSVPVELVGQQIEAHVFAEKISVMKQGKVVVQLQRCYGLRQTIAELAHYLPILKYKPGALPGSLALHQARQNGKWSNILEDYWQALISRYKANDANRQLVDFLLWAKDFDLREIEDLAAKAMSLGCYQLESIKTLMRQQQYQEQIEPLGAKLLGSLKCYDRPKLGTTGYNALLTGGAT